jgi:hypothetical protein
MTKLLNLFAVVVIVLSVLFTVPVVHAQNAVETVGTVTLAGWGAGNTNTLSSGRVGTFNIIVPAQAGWLSMRAAHAYSTEPYVTINGNPVRPMTHGLSNSNDGCGSVLVHAGDVVLVHDTNTVIYGFGASRQYATLNTYDVHLPMVMR